MPEKAPDWTKNITWNLQSSLAHSFIDCSFIFCAVFFSLVFVYYFSCSFLLVAGLEHHRHTYQSLCWVALGKRRAWGHGRADPPWWKPWGWRGAREGEREAGGRSTALGCYAAPARERAGTVRVQFNKCQSTTNHQLTTSISLARTDYWQSWAMTTRVIHPGMSSYPHPRLHTPCATITLLKMPSQSAPCPLHLEIYITCFIMTLTPSTK